MSRGISLLVQPRRTNPIFLRPFSYVTSSTTPQNPSPTIDRNCGSKNWLKRQVVQGSTREPVTRHVAPTNAIPLSARSRYANNSRLRQQLGGVLRARDCLGQPLGRSELTQFCNVGA